MLYGTVAQGTITIHIEAATHMHGEQIFDPCYYFRYYSLETITGCIHRVFYYLYTAIIISRTTCHVVWQNELSSSNVTQS